MATSLLDVISGITYPEQEVVIFTDLAALEKFGALEEEAAKLGEEDFEKNNALMEEQEALKAQIMESKWTFTLRGIPRSILEVIGKKYSRTKDVSERIEEINTEIVLRSVVSVTGSGDENIGFDEDTLKEFFGAIPADVWAKFTNAANILSGNSLRYEQKVLDPNFS